MRIWLWLLVIFAGPACGQTERDDARLLAARLQSLQTVRGGSKPLAELPSHIPPPKEGLALTADFEHPTKAGLIPIFLINRSGHRAVLDSQDGDIFLKLEYHDSDGTWRRAQPHLYSWCGNSYHPLPPVPDGHFLMLEGSLPKEGPMETVRFRLYQSEASLQLASNTVMAHVSAELVRIAANDRMRVTEAGFDELAAIALGKIVLRNALDDLDLRGFAIWRLGQPRFGAAESLEVLRTVAAGSDRYSIMAQDTATRIESRQVIPAGGDFKGAAQRSWVFAMLYGILLLALGYALVGQVVRLRR